jgi:hypothetical protein
LWQDIQILMSVNIGKIICSVKVIEELRVAGCGKAKLKAQG